MVFLFGALMFSRSVFSNPEQGTIVSLHERLMTKYFEVTANDVKISYDHGTTLMVNLTYKNIDSKNRKIENGHVFVKGKGGKTYKIDVTLTKTSNAVHMQLKTQTSIKIDIAFKIPNSMSGRIYYQPADSYEGSFIDLGELY